MLVEIYSDVVCPWCYIGKRRWEKALAEFEGRDDVTVVWRPYQLDPTAPAEPQPVLDAYASQFGGPGQAVKIVRHVSEVAAGEGLAFRMEDGQRANTFDAHRLLWWTAGTERQDVLKERLLAAYFTEGSFLGDCAELVRLAAEAGLDATATGAFLASTEGVTEVHDELADAQELGITAVPTFVFEGRFALPGAQDPETMLAVLRRVQERFVTPARTADDAGGACDDGSCSV
ncbi:MAG: DsbA family oxidoreductase [Acidimicrobiales bacterium]